MSIIIHLTIPDYPTSKNYDQAQPSTVTLWINARTRIQTQLYVNVESITPLQPPLRWYCHHL